MESALNQYIDLFGKCRETIDRGSCEVMNAVRPRALEKTINNFLPKKGSENYEITDLQAILAPDYGLNLEHRTMDANPAASFRCGVPNLSTSLFLTVDDMPAESHTAHRTLPEGVIAGSLRKYASEKPELFQRYYAAIADMGNPLVALNSLLAQDGFVLYVPKGVKIDKPLQLVNIFQAPLDMMAARRVLIILEDDAEARLLVCDHTQNAEHNYLSLQTVEIFAGKNSRFDLYDLEESTEKTSRLCSLYLKQGEGSNVLIDGVTLYNGTTRNEYYCHFDGEHAALRLLGMAIEDNRRNIASHTEVNHAVGHCTSDQLFKYVAQDEALGAFSGRIKVDYGAVKTQAYQSNRNIVDSDTARIFSKPQLEIYNDDVKCSHGTAIGQLDQMQLFYMRTRGLDEATARQLLKQAFMADVIEGVRLPMLRDRLHALVEQRFAGIRHDCSQCADSCLAADQPSI